MKKGKIPFVAFVLGVSMLLASPKHNTKDLSKDNKDDLDSLTVPDKIVEIIAEATDDLDLEYVPYNELKSEIAEKEVIIDGKNDEQIAETDNIEERIDEETIDDPTTPIDNTIEEEPAEVKGYEFNLGYICNDNLLKARNEDGTVELFRIDMYQKVFILEKQSTQSLVEFVTDDNQVMVGYINNDSYRVLPGTFVEIDKDLQVERLYVDGEVVLESPIVTGLEWSTPTPIGCYQIWAKEKGVFLKGYDDYGNLTYSNYVDFWEPFNGGIGLHDAERHTDYDANGNPITIHGWRNLEDFGGKTYTYGGSHGCVNETHEAAEIIYENTEVGTPVLVHK